MRKLLGAALALFASATFAATTVPVQLLNPAGSTAGQVVVSAGASTPPAWGGIGLSGIAAIAANSLIGNATNATAGVTAVTVTGCNGAAQALQWTNGSGFGCNSAVATSGANSNITSLAGLTTALSIAQGGTGANTASGARTNLGLGTAATANTGTSGSVVPLLNTANTWSLGQTFSVRPTFNGATPWDSANLNFAMPPAIGGTTPAAGAFTSLSATGTITGSTLVSTGNVQGPAAGYSISTVTGVSSGGGIQIFDGTHGNNVSITNAGSPVASFNGSGVTFANTAGVVGVTGASTAPAGVVGENKCQTGSGVSLTSGTLTNITSVSLAAGEYQIGGNIAFNPAAGTTMTLTSGSTSTTSATNGTLTNSLNLSFPTGLGQSYALAQQFYKFTATTTVFLVAASTFSGGTNSGTGTLCWLRIR